MRYEDKLRQADREARAALAGLAATIIVWAACGFGLAPSGVYVFSTPLWVVAGCGGTFLFAVGVAVWMACHVMKDVGLDDVDADAGAGGGAGEDECGAGAGSGAGENRRGGNAAASANGDATRAQVKTGANGDGSKARAVCGNEPESVQAGGGAHPLPAKARP